MTTKKQLLKEIEALKEKLSQVDDTQFKTSQILAMEQMVAMKKAQQNILSGDNALDDITKLSDYNLIVKNQIPTKLTWLYWIWINEHLNYWVGRYNDFDAPESVDKEQLIIAITIAILYGRAVYSKSKKLAYWVNYRTDNGDYVLTPCSEFIGVKDAYDVNTTGKYDIKSEYKNNKITLPADDCCDLSFQRGYIGIYVWYLIYGCLYLLTSLYISCNASMLVNKIFYEVNDLDKFKDEIKYITDPFSNVVPIHATNLLSATNIPSKRGINELAGTENKVLPFKLSSTDTNQMSQLIEANKYINETLHYLYGIPITSAKNQSLSADANLSASTSKLKMYEHDRRIIEPIKKVLGITITPREDEVIQPMNENADKDGLGIVKTDGEKVKEEAK